MRKKSYEVSSPKILRAVIIGTGKIGTDLLIKLQSSKLIKIVLFIGRRLDSQGIDIAKSLNVNFSIGGSDDLEKYSEEYDVVFDATSALDHFKHHEIIKRYNKKIIDLTPSKIGETVIPIINGQDILKYDDISMITCGGQATIPIVYAISKVHKNIPNIEIVSSVASKTVGAATRRNIDHYIYTTESAIKKFSGCLQAKAILNINPALPCVSMKTTIFAEIPNYEIEKINENVYSIVSMIQKYIPGYKLLVPPYFDGGKLITILEIKASGYLPTYAGNIEIITAAAIQVAENLSL